MENDLHASALERVTPRRLWAWAIILAIVGIVLRVLWFVSYEHDLPFAFGSTASGHLWWLQDAPGAAHQAGSAIDSYAITRAFAPGYGVALHLLDGLTGGDKTAITTALLAIQSLLAALTTLITFALSRRVLFGTIALLPSLLLTFSLALIELPGGLAPSVAVMFLLTLAIWLITMLREKLAAGREPGIVLLTIGGGFALGSAVLFNPATLLCVPLILWWAFRGLGRDDAILLIVATVLLPACWFAVAQSQISGGVPIEQGSAWFDTANDRIASSPEELADRAYAVATPWNPRFARGSYEAANWNYERVIPASLRADSTYVVATRVVFILLIAASALFVMAGVFELFAEGAGSSARLIALPVISVPFATFLAPEGNLLRLSVLPLIAISLALGLTWLSELSARNR